MADIREMFEDVYRKAEDTFYTMLDWLDERGIPAYNVHDWLEDHGIPPFPAFAATLLLLIGGISFALLNSPTYTVMVTVTDSQTGLGVAGASVKLMSGGTIVAATTTNSSGTAIFSGIKEGTYTVKVYADNYNPATGAVTVSSDISSASIKLEPLTPHNEFCLQVLDNAGNAVTNAQVTIGGSIADYDADYDEYCAKVSSDTVAITVIADGFSTYTNTVDASQGTKDHPFVVTLTPQTASAAGATYSMGVHVIGPDGKPLSYAPVYLYSADGKKVVTQTVTDDNGAASFDDVPAGQYLLVATDPKDHKAVAKTIQLDEDTDVTADLSGSDAYTYEGNDWIPTNIGPVDENELNKEIQEVNANGNVGRSGSEITTGSLIPVIFDVYDAKTDKPIKGAQINIVSGTFTTSATTNNNGIAELNLPTGEYNITVSEENYITYTITRKVSQNGQWIEIPMHHDYTPAITLLGLFGPEGEVATLQNGTTTTLHFQVSIPYGVKSATLTVGVGEKWQDREEILSEISVDGDVNRTFNLKNYAESIREITVPVDVTNNVQNIGDNPRIHWTYTVVGEDGQTTTLTGEVRPTVTKDALKCGYGWAMNFDVVGPAPKPFVLYPDTDYTVRVEYAKCVNDGTTPQAVLYVDRDEVSRASVSASKRYDYGTVDLPLRLTPDQAGQRKIDVRLVSGEENVVTRKYVFYAVVNEVPPAYKYSAGLPHGAKLAYRGLETTVKVGVWAHDRNINSAMIAVDYVGNDGNTETVSKTVAFPPYEQWKYEEFNITPYGDKIKVTIRFLSANGKVIYTEMNTFTVTDYMTPVQFHFVDALTGEDVNNVTVVLENDAHNYTFISNGNGIAEGNAALGDYTATIMPPEDYVSITMPLKVSQGMSPITVQVHHDYNAFVDLMGMYTKAGASVGTLPMGERVTLRFQVGVPYDVTSAEFNVALGANWMTEEEITSVATINGGTSATYDLSGYAESIQTIEVPVKVVNDPKNNEERIRIAWTYKYTDTNGTHTITGYIYPAVTEQALRCGDGWAANFRVDGPKPTPTNLFINADYKVHVEYARCDADAPSVTAALYVDKNKVTTGAVSASRRYDFGTVELPAKFTADQAGERKIDVRLIAGKDENVIARKFKYYTVLGQGPTICMTLATDKNPPYVGQTVTVTATPTDCNGNKISVHTDEINMIITGGHAVDNPPLYMTRQRDKFVYTFTPKRYGDVTFACKSSVYTCRAVKPDTIWIFAKNGLEITGQKIFWVPKANHNGVKRINTGTYHIFNYTIYPVKIDEVNVTCKDPAAEATATQPGTVQSGTYSDFLVKVSYAGDAETFTCTISARGHYEAPNGLRRYMTAKYDFTVATRDLALAVDAPQTVNVIPGVSTEFNVTVGTNNSNKTAVSDVRLVAHTLDNDIHVSIHPNSTELPPGETRSFTVIVSATGDRRTTKIKFDASGKVGLYTVHSNDAETAVNVEDPRVVEANIISPKNGTHGVEVKGTSATIDVGFYKSGELNLEIRNLTSHTIYVYPEDLVAKSSHVILSMEGKRESPAEIKANGKYKATYKINPTTNAPFDPETIRLRFKIAARSADGRIVSPIPDVVFPITISRHSSTCLKIDLALAGGNASPNKPVAVAVKNDCGFPVDVAVHAMGASIQPSSTIHVGTEGNYYTLTFSKAGTYSTYVKGTGVYEDIRSNTITIPVKTVEEKKTSAEVLDCGSGASTTVQLFSINDAPFAGTGDCRIDYCGYAETEKFLAQQVSRIYKAAQSAEQVGKCSGEFCDVTGQVAETEMTIHVKSLPAQINWQDVADIVAKTAGVQLQVREGEPNLSTTAASVLHYNGDQIKSPGDYEITFRVYRNRLYPDEVIVSANIKAKGLNKDYYNGFYTPIFINLGEYTGEGLSQTAVEFGTKTYIVVSQTEDLPVVKRLVAQQMLAKAFSTKRLDASVIQDESHATASPHLIIKYGDCDGMFLASVDAENNATITICNSYVSDISDPTNDPKVSKLAETFYHFLAMDGSVQGCMKGKGFLVRGYNEKLAQTKLAATNDIFVMPGVWSWRTLTFNLGVEGVPRTFKVISFAVNGADNGDVKILLKTSGKMVPLAKDNEFTVNTDGSVEANVWLNPEMDYRDAVHVVVGLQDTISKQTFLGVIHIHPVAVKESDLIKTAVLPNYQLPGDTYGRYPAQLLANISQAFFAVDGHEGLDKQAILNDVLDAIGGQDALANRNEIDLPLYVYHDLDSCTAVSLRIWSTLQDAAYASYVVKADLESPDGTKCQLPEVGVYSTKHIAEQIGSKGGITAFAGPCAATTLACDLATASLSGGAGLVAAVGDVAGCVMPPLMAGKVLGGRAAQAASIAGNAGGMPLGALGAGLFTKAVTVWGSQKKRAPVEKFLPLRNELIARSERARTSATKFMDAWKRVGGLAEKPPKIATMQIDISRPGEYKTLLKEYAEKNPQEFKEMVAAAITEDEVAEYLEKHPELLDQIISQDPKGAVLGVAEADPQAVARALTSDPELLESVIKANPDVFAEIVTNNAKLSETLMQELTTNTKLIKTIASADPDAWKKIAELAGSKVGDDPLKIYKELYVPAGQDGATEYARSFLEVLLDKGYLKGQDRQLAEAILAEGAGIKIDGKLKGTTYATYYISDSQDAKIDLLKYFNPGDQELKELGGIALYRSAEKNPKILDKMLSTAEWKRALIEAMATDKTVAETVIHTDPAVILKNSGELADILGNDRKALSNIINSAAGSEVDRILKQLYKVDPNLARDVVKEAREAEDLVKPIILDETIKAVEEGKEAPIAEKIALTTTEIEKIDPKYVVNPEVVKSLQKELGLSEEEARKLAEELAKEPDLEKRKALLAEAVLKKYKLGDQLQETIEQLGDMAKSGAISEEDFYKALKEMGIDTDHLDKYGIDVLKDEKTGKITGVTISTDDFYTKLADDVSKGKVPAAISNPGTLRSIFQSIISKWGILDAKYVQWAEHSITGKNIRKRIYQFGQQHQMTVGLLCAAAGQAVGTLSEWAHVNPNADKYIAIDGNLADGLEITAKAGSQTWTVKVG